jgi:hypothetical protein
MTWARQGSNAPKVSGTLWGTVLAKPGSLAFAPDGSTAYVNRLISSSSSAVPEPPTTVPTSEVEALVQQIVDRTLDRLKGDAEPECQAA